VLAAALSETRIIGPSSARSPELRSRPRAERTTASASIAFTTLADG
jgi:hypothetical protein